VLGFREEVRERKWRSEKGKGGEVEESSGQSKERVILLISG